MNASQFRNTRFEFRSLVQQANGFGVHASERAIFGSPSIEHDLGEALFTPDEMAQVQATLELLERKYEAERAQWENAPERARELIADAAQAKRDLEAAQAEHAKLDEEIKAKRAEAAALAASTPAATPGKAEQ